MAKSEIYHQIEVESDTGNYPVFIGSHLIDDESLIQTILPSKRVMVISNERVSTLYWPKLANSLKGFVHQQVNMPDGEANKSLDTANMVYQSLIYHGFHRDDVIVALGGGVVGDLAGFVAATWQRGAPFVQIPTTLLAMVDASVGGKTAINVDKAKNIVGAFHQPSAVVIDINTLNTLPEREFKAGMAEVIKYGLITSGNLISNIETILSTANKSPAAMADLIADCVRIKADIVSQDPREQGVRALLNLGHTFAHALEAESGWTRWLHGEAVGIGLYCAGLMSFMRGHFNEDELKNIKKLLKLAGLKHTIPNDINLKSLRLRMQQDKKIQKNRLRFILMRSMGDCFIADDVEEDLLMAVLAKAQEGRE